MRGWTLLELLLAIAIALLVVTLLYAAYHTAVATLRTQDRTHRRTDGAAEVLRRLGEDLLRAFVPAGDDACSIRLEPGEGGGAIRFGRLAFCTAAPRGTEWDPRWHEVVHVTYEVVDEGGEAQLVRRVQALAGPGAEEPPDPEVVARAVTGLEFRFFDGTTWVETWPPGDATAMPLAARIQVALHRDGVDHQTATEIFLPAGTRVGP